MVCGLAGRAGSCEWGDLRFHLPLHVFAEHRQPGKGSMTHRCQSGNANCWGFVGIYLVIGMTLNAGKVLQMQNQGISVQ